MTNRLKDYWPCQDIDPLEEIPPRPKRMPQPSPDESGMIVTVAIIVGIGLLIVAELGLNK